jgi:surfactin synthase thioesterase subunit
MIPPVRNDPWFLCTEPRHEAKMRLFCLPFAGAGASVYRTWSGVFPRSIEIRAVQLPGRESRLREPRIRNAVILAHEIADALCPYLDRPFALFGYSLGALLAFETVRALRRQGKPQPACLFAAAMHAPHLPDVHPPLSQLPHDRFIEQVNAYFQPQDAAWRIPELLDMLLPILRDDMSMVDSYDYSIEPPLACPIDVYIGTEDRSVPAPSAQAWQEQTAAGFRMTAFPGTHFFLHSALPQLQEKVSHGLAALLDNGYPA